MELKSIQHNSDNKEILFILSCEHITSVNNLYNARVGRKNGKAYPIIFRSADAVKFSEEVELQLDKIDFKQESPWLWDTPYYNLTVQFVMNKSYNMRDTSNCIKLLEDCLFRHLGLNDARNIELHTYKSYLPESKEELIMIRLSESHHSFMFKSGI